MLNLETYIKVLRRHLSPTQRSTFQEEPARKAIQYAMDHRWSIQERTVRRTATRGLVWTFQINAPTERALAKSVVALMKAAGFQRPSNHTFVFDYDEEPM